MSTFVLTDAFILLSAVNLSASGRSLRLRVEAEQQDDTAFADTTRSRLGGLKDWSAEVEFNQDYAASNVDVTLFPLVGTVIAVEFRPTSAARSTTNPAYTGNALVTSYEPLGNQVGEAARARLSLVAAGALTRATA
jgi:hypothetical protein